MDETPLSAQPDQPPAPNRRRTDFTWGNCAWCAAVTKFWDWIDDRNIDQHVVTFLTLYGTWKVTHWGMAFAEAHQAMTGAEMALVMGAVLGPYSLLQGAVLKWYFSRTKD